MIENYVYLYFGIGVAITYLSKQGNTMSAYGTTAFVVFWPLFAIIGLGKVLFELITN